MTNKYGVPHHIYQIHLANNTTKWVDIADESDWGDIQHCVYGDTFVNGEVDPPDCLDRIGFGNDADGHIEIDEVIDTNDGKHLDIREWAEYVWSFVDNYSA